MAQGCIRPWPNVVEVSQGSSLSIKSHGKALDHDLRPHLSALDSLRSAVVGKQIPSSLADPRGTPGMHTPLDPIFFIFLVFGENWAK